MSIFVDTGAWFASVVPADRHHLKVVAFLQHNPLPLITTDYVIDETLTLLRARGEVIKAISLGRQLLDLQMANVVHITPQVFSKAWEIFRDQPSRRWSFTDCTSKIVMQERHIRKALALDQHFTEFGAVGVLE
ncbi:MAG TPA: PIN domain-containing protein [Humisphaera sp.]|nr:PIN domain-containing protein [Humisphaera sp.]